MLIRILLVTSLLVWFSSCTTTNELRRARLVNEHRVMTYLPDNGRIYRLEPFEQPTVESPRAMPNFEALSYSPLKSEPAVVQMNKGKMMPAQARPRSPVVSYSPLTGEAVIIK